MPLMLRTDLNLRKDVDRIVVYQRDVQRCGTSRDSFGWRLLHPNLAILVCLFDGAKSTERVISEFSYLTDLTPENARLVVGEFLAKNGAMMEEVAPGSPPQHRYDPGRFLIDASRLDFSMDRLRLPIGCVWIVTLGCAYNCVYCYADVERGAHIRSQLLDLGQVREVVAQFREIELGRVGVSGGDPFAHPQLLDVLRVLSEAGYTPEVPTKTPLTKSALEGLKELGHPSVQFSLDTPLDGQIVAEHLGIPQDGYLPRVLRSMEAANEVGLKVAINAVITNHNVDHVEDMIRFYGSLGFVYRLSLSQAGASIYRTFPDLLVEKERYKAYEARIDQFKTQYPHMSVNLSWLAGPDTLSAEERAEWFRSRPRCSGGRWEFALLPDGSMTLCEELYYHPEFVVGNVLETPIAELWNSERMHSILYPEQDVVAHGPCSACEWLHECNLGKGRCWVRALKAYRDQPEPHNWPDPFCPSAPRATYRVV